MRDYKYKAGDVIDGWILIEPLGYGGNAEVWKADHSGEIAALKILRSTHSESDSFKRFRKEVEFVEASRGEEGVLPILGYQLENPSKSHPAWVAMPVAETIKEALGDAPSLREIVETMAQIAETLVRLKTKYNLNHRDIKPSNLYSYNNQWVIADFGLIKLPDGDNLTRTGNKFGPGGFIPDELISIKDSKDIDWSKVDVFLIAKTLWVLANGKEQKFPPQGHIARTNSDIKLSTILHPDIVYINNLIDNATQSLPESRPTMENFATQLRAWLDENPHPAMLQQRTHLAQTLRDVTTASRKAAMARPVLAQPRIRTDEEKRERKEKINQIAQELEEAMKDFKDAIDNGEFYEVKRHESHVNNFNPYEPFDGAGLAKKGIFMLYGAGWRETNASPVEVRKITAYKASLYGDEGYLLCIAVVALFEDDELQVIAGYFTQLGDVQVENLWHTCDTVQFDTALQRNLIRRLKQTLPEKLDEAIREFKNKWQAKDKDDDTNT